MIISCLQTVPKETIEEALDEALDLASIAIKDNSKFLFLPKYCGGITSNGKLYFYQLKKYPFVFANWKNFFSVVAKIYKINFLYL